MDVFVQFAKTNVRVFGGSQNHYTKKFPGLVYVLCRDLFETKDLSLDSQICCFRRLFAWNFKMPVLSEKLFLCEVIASPVPS